MTSVNRIDIIKNDRTFLDLLRGVSITRVVLVHLGLSWFYSPYSDFVHSFMPILFFVSGVVSFNSYLRSETMALYLYKRIISIYIPYLLLILISLFIDHLLVGGSSYNVMDKIIYILTINLAEYPMYMPYPLGQVWFLHALIIIIIITAPLFYYKTASNILLLIIIIMSIVLSVVQMQLDLSKYMYLAGHNMYQPLVNSGFFAFGALCYFKGYQNHACVLMRLIVVSLLIFLLMLFCVEDINMYKHIYAPDIYYISLSYLIILSILYFKNHFVAFLERFYFVNYFFLFMSNNAYSVFLLHSFALWFVHNKVGIASVKHNYGMAVIKIIAVFAVTCAMSIPFTKITNIVKDIIIRKIHIRHNFCRRNN